MALGINYLIANAVGFIVTVFNAYVLQSKFVFEKKSKGHGKAVLKTYSAYGFTFLVSTGLLYLMVSVFGISKYIAPILVLFVTVPLNFCLNKFWVYR